MAAKGDRVVFGMTRLAQEIQNAIDTRSVQQVADEWGVPYWVIRDTISGRIQCPRPLYLPKIAAGLGQSTDTIIELAYTDLVPA